MIKTSKTALSVLAMLIFLFFASSSHASHPFPFTLKDPEGEPTAPDSTKPYSLKETCGSRSCHDYETVTQGFHFQQGRDEYDPDFALKNPGHGFVHFDQSPGMFGKWSPYFYRQLAKKDNDNETEIDLPAFEWVKSCGVCHPGGGPMKFDRDGNRYDEQALLMDENTLDGDYYNHVEDWQNSGFVEADCFICHLQGYNILARNAQVQEGNFRVAQVAGAGLGEITDNDHVAYNSAAVKSLSDRLNARPDDENCSQCHAGVPERLFAASGEIRSGIAKRGFSWNDDSNPDVHNRAGIMCIDCHSGRLKHQLEKGHTSTLSARDDLDNTMMKCADCHSEGGYPGASIPAHAELSLIHLEKIDCATCHIPRKNFFAVRTMDFSTGTANRNFTGGSPEDTAAISGFKPVYFKWESESGGEEKIFPGNPIAYVYWNDGDDMNPVFAGIVSSAFESLPEGTVKDDTGNLRQEVNTKEEIEAMALALKRQGVKDPKLLALKPERCFQLSHNIAPASEALVCTDCHSPGSYFFSGEVMLYSYEIDETAAEADAYDRFVLMKEFTGYSQEKIDEMENLDTTTSTGICPLVFLSKGESRKTGLLRKFRDRVMSKTLSGRKYIRLFYKHSPEITSILAENPGIRAQAEEVLGHVIPHVRSFLETGSVRLPCETVDMIIDLCDSIRQKATLELRKTIKILKAELNNNLSGAVIQPCQQE